MTPVFGSDTTTRQILTSMYLTILLVSCGCLAFGFATSRLAWPLFAFQIVYKILSLGLIKERRVPVYWFNLGIACFHGLTLGLTFT